MKLDPRTGIAFSAVGSSLKLALIFALETKESKTVNFSTLRKRTSLIRWRLTDFSSTRGLDKAIEELKEKGLIARDVTGVRLSPFGRKILEAIKGFQVNLLTNHESWPHEPIDEDTRTGAMVRMCLTCGARSFGNKGSEKYPTEWGPWIFLDTNKVVPDCPGFRPNA